jgi:hypothetical protein
MRWVGAPETCRPISFSGKPLKGTPRDPRGAAALPERSSPTPGRRLDAAGVDPKRVEAGFNRLLLPCPAPLAPGRRSAATAVPHSSIGEGSAWSSPSGALALDQAWSRLAMRKPARGPKGPTAASPEPCASCRHCLWRLRHSQTGRSNLRTGAAAPPSDAPPHPGGRRGDVSFTG